MPAHEHCCVPDCNNRQNRNPELSFHTFPKNKEQKYRWILAIKWDEGPAFKVTNSTVVCNAHFLPSDYAVEQRQHRWTLGLSSTKKKHKQLKKDAIPSSFAFRAVQEPRRTLIRFTSPPPVHPAFRRDVKEV